MWYEPGYVGEKMIDCLSNCFYFPAKYETRSLDDNVLVVGFMRRFCSYVHQPGRIIIYSPVYETGLESSIS